MTIRAKMRLSASIAGTLVLITGLFVAGALARLDRIQQKAAQAVEINQAITEIRFVTFQNVLRHDERSREQWHLKHEDIVKLVTPLRVHTLAERDVLTDIRSRQEEAKATFDKLSSIPDPIGASKDAQLTRDLRERLANQLLIKQQQQIAKATELSTMNRQELKVRLTRIGWALMTPILLILLILVLSARLITRTINSSLVVLQEGAEAISAGDLQHRIHISRRDEFGVLATAFNTMAVNLEQVDKMKTQFLNIAAHQLRTPITSIRWSLEELLRAKGKAKQLTQPPEKLLDIAHKANNQLGARVDDLLTAIDSNAEHVRLNKQPSDIATLLQHVLDEMAEDFAQKQIDTQVSLPKTPLPPIEVDSPKIQSVFRRLLHNAQLYTEANGTVKVTLTSKGGRLRFEVTDTGIGIPKDEQKNIFGRFVRASNAFTITPDSSGLSLYIVKHVIEAHHGKVGFTSQESNGSTFWFELPLS